MQLRMYRSGLCYWFIIILCSTMMEGCAQQELKSGLKNNGMDVDATYPLWQRLKYVVKFQIGTGPLQTYCSGTVLNGGKVVLTAAHCFLLHGTHAPVEFSFDGVRYTAKEIALATAFDGSGETPKDDLALIWLDKTIATASDAPMISTTIAEKVISGDELLFAGYGPVPGPDHDRDGIPDDEDLCPLSPRGKPKESIGTRKGCAQGEKISARPLKPRSENEKQESRLRSGTLVIERHEGDSQGTRQLISAQHDVSSVAKEGQVVVELGDSGGPLLTKEGKAIVGVLSRKTIAYTESGTILRSIFISVDSENVKDFFRRQGLMKN